MTVRRHCASAAEARAFRAAVAADNPAYLSVEVVGRELLVRLTAPSAASARATMEDLMACLTAAERTRERSGR